MLEIMSQKIYRGTKLNLYFYDLLSILHQVLLHCFLKINKNEAVSFKRNSDMRLMNKIIQYCILCIITNEGSFKLGK